VPDPGVPTTIALGAFVAGEGSPLHALIRRFRAGDEAAYRVAFNAAARALADHADQIPAASLLVAVPSHSPDDMHRPLDRLVADLAARADRTAVGPPSLRRVREVPEAKLVWTNPARLAASLRWAPSRPCGSIVLVDDVIRSGATIEACLAAIAAASPSARVALVLGLTRAMAHNDEAAPTAG
jgi:predicted amidophosphoribosyltransferase